MGRETGYCGRCGPRRSRSYRLLPFSIHRKGIHSQRKKRTARIVQSAATPSMTPIGSRTLPALMPKNVFFIIVSPCVSGKMLTIFCIAFGMTSIGSVVPEKTSMGRSWCFFLHRLHPAVRIPFRFLPKDPDDRPRFSRHRFSSALQQKSLRSFLNPPDCP